MLFAKKKFFRLKGNINKCLSRNNNRFLLLFSRRYLDYDLKIFLNHFKPIILSMHQDANTSIYKISNFKGENPV